MLVQKKSLNVKGVAEIYGLNPGTLANLRSQKQGAKYYKVERKAMHRV